MRVASALLLSLWLASAAFAEFNTVNTPDVLNKNQGIQILKHPEGARQQKQVVAYFPNWSMYRRDFLVNPETIHYEKYTIINYAFFKPLATGHIISTDTWADDNILLGPFIWYPEVSNDYTRSLPYLAAESGVRLLPSIGGWGESSHYPAIAADPAKRQIFVQDCVNLINTFNFNGIDIDWEYPGYAPHNGSAADTANFTLLLQELRTALDSLSITNSEEYLLTACFGATETHMSYIDWANVVPLLDLINFMTYDFSGDWSEYSNHHTPLFPPLDSYSDMSVVGAFTLLTETFMVPAEKINLGLAFYGKAFADCSHLGGTHSGYDTVTFPLDFGEPHYYSIIENIANFTYHWDDQALCPYLLGNDFDTFVTYDDELSIYYKAQLVADHNAAGVIIWDITGDYIETSPNSGIIAGTPLIDAVLNAFPEPQNAPQTPTNLEVVISGSDTILSWDPVTEDVTGQPIEVDYYLIYICNPETNSSIFYLLDMTTTTTYLHQNSTLESRSFLYYIKAVISF